jgi:PAS domain S-box-containing protein
MPDSEEQLKLYRLLVEHSLGLMCIHDLNGVLISINPAAA